VHRFASVAVVDQHGRVLMQERDEHAPVHPDLWGLPGGRLEPGETFVEAAARELEEETGLRIGVDELVSLGRNCFHSEPCGGTDCYELFATYAEVSDADVTCGEGRQMVFVDPAALFDLPLLVAATMQLPDLLDSPAYRDRFGGAPSRRFSSVGLVAPSGAVLMQERDDNPILDPGRWGLPGGHLDDGESFLDGAVRELAEETGVTVDPASLTLVAEARVDHTDVYGSHDRMRFFVAATDLDDDGVECREGRQMVFVDGASVPELPLTRSASAVVPGFLQSALYARLAT
jgi:8-oxo-dGTP pyrophosphatase MutT (NUDIX family)